MIYNLTLGEVVYNLTLLILVAVSSYTSQRFWENVKSFPVCEGLKKLLFWYPSPEDNSDYAKVRRLLRINNANRVVNNLKEYDKKTRRLYLLYVNYREAEWLMVAQIVMLLMFTVSMFMGFMGFIETSITTAFTGFYSALFILLYVAYKFRRVRKIVENIFGKE